jgi:mRNA interferase HigB
MKVRLVKKKTIDDYEKENAASRIPFRAWFTAVKKANWDNPRDFLSIFGSADLLGNGTNRVIFDIGGNLYRMICRYAFSRLEVRLFICWIGTHAEYTKLCNKKEQYTIRKY